MKEFLKKIEAQIRDLWPIVIVLVLVGCWLGYVFYTKGLKGCIDGIVIITVYIIYKLVVFVWGVLNKIKGFDKVVLNVKKVVMWVIILFFGLVILEVFGILIFRDYLGYNYYPFTNYIFKWLNDFCYH